MSMGKNNYIKFMFIVLVLFGTVLISGCKNGNSALPPPPSKPPVENVASVVSVDWLAENLGATNLKVIYVGTGGGAKRSYKKGNIPGSIFIDANDIMESPKTKGKTGIVANKEKFEKVMSKNGISTDDVIVVYGKYSGAWDAAWVARMWWTLKYYGHKKAGFLDGGIETWKSKGMKLSGGSPTVTPTAYSAAEPDASLRATGDYVLAKLNNPKNVVILDDREIDEWEGKAKFGSERGGRIPGAVFLNWKEVMNSDRTFKPKEELKQMYEAKGVTPDKEIIIYCQGGVRVSHTLFVLKEILGYPNVRNYDGSWDEWANTKKPDGTYKYPVEK